MDLNDLIGHKDDFDTVSTQSRKEPIFDGTDGRLMTPKVKL